MIPETDKRSGRSISDAYPMAHKKNEWQEEVRRVKAARVGNTGIRLGHDRMCWWRNAHLCASWLQARSTLYIRTYDVARRMQSMCDRCRWCAWEVSGMMCATAVHQVLADLACLTDLQEWLNYWTDAGRYSRRHGAGSIRLAAALMTDSCWCVNKCQQASVAIETEIRRYVQNLANSDQGWIKDDPVLKFIQLEYFHANEDLQPETATEHETNLQKVKRFWDVIKMASVNITGIWNGKIISRMDRNGQLSTLKSEKFIIKVMKAWYL